MCTTEQQFLIAEDVMVNPRHNRPKKGICKHTMLSLTCVKGISIMSVTAFFVSIALRLNVEKGTHVGICLENGVSQIVRST